MGIRLIYRGTGSGLRVMLLAAGAAAACVGAAVLLLFLLPRPHGHVHYLLAGMTPPIAALIALLVRTQQERARPRRWPVRRAPAGQ